jgi:exopolysaccharide biosynthesis polyprenyl glycosylphosphotransferase
MDVAGSLVLLALLSPVLLAAAAAVKVTSPGPVLFRQERLGINKRRFRMLKFRTMVEGAESLIAELEAMNEAEGPVFKLRNDPRVTKVGAFLRRTSIDELPQLFNVLRGEMSLVGPRPLPVRDYLGFEAEWHKRRFSVKPGITCLWQISGRSNVGFDEWIRMDLDYIDRWSFGLDLQILLRTIPAVLRREGAA